jgi:tRNA threonylcarbamoyladenosine biosynthesis protein TsaE
LSSTETLRSQSPAETEALGAHLASDLHPGDVVLVSGDLGSGKTTLIRGACRALGVEGPVTSPTFTIGQRYRGHVPISHLDLFRLETLEGEEPGLVEDYLGAEEIAFIEWPDAAEPQLERVAMRIRLRHAEGDSRAIEIDRSPRGG